MKKVLFEVPSFKEDERQREGFCTAYDTSV